MQIKLSMRDQKYKNLKTGSEFSFADVIDMIEQTLDHPKRKLTDWEIEFLESIYDQFYRTSNISPKQLQILEKIYSETTL